MKKLFVILLAACGLVVVSCTSVEDKAKNYADEMVQAMKDGDMEKLQKIGKEYDEWAEGLSAEDKEKATKAVMEKLPDIQGAIGSMLGGAMDNAADALENATDDASDAMDDAADKASSEMEDALDQASKEMEDAMDQASKDMEDAVNNALGQ